ncbi:unnamed protein product [Victoria cruziana]
MNDSSCGTPHNFWPIPTTDEHKSTPEVSPTGGLVHLFRQASPINSFESRAYNLVTLINLLLRIVIIFMQ